MTEDEEAVAQREAPTKSLGFRIQYRVLEGFPDGTEVCQCRRHRRCRFDPWVRKIPWRRKWQPTPVFLPKKLHGQRSLAGYSPWGLKELDMTV